MAKVTLLIQIEVVYWKQGFPFLQLVNVRVRRSQQLGIQIVKLLILYTVGRCEAMPAEKTLLCNFFFQNEKE